MLFKYFSIKNNRFLKKQKLVITKLLSWQYHRYRLVCTWICDNSINTPLFLPKVSPSFWHSNSAQVFEQISSAVLFLVDKQSLMLDKVWNVPLELLIKYVSWIILSNFWSSNFENSTSYIWRTWENCSEDKWGLHSKILCRISFEFCKSLKSVIEFLTWPKVHIWFLLI